MSPKIRDGERIGTGRKQIELKKNVALSCDAQGYPTPDFRFNERDSHIKLYHEYTVQNHHKKLLLWSKSRKQYNHISTPF